MTDTWAGSLFNYLRDCFVQPYKRESMRHYVDKIFSVIEDSEYSQFTSPDSIPKDELKELIHTLNARISNRDFLDYYIHNDGDLFTDGKKYFYTFSELTFYDYPDLDRFKYLENNSLEVEILGGEEESTKVTRYEFDHLRIAFAGKNSPFYIFDSFLHF